MSGEFKQFFNNRENCPYLRLTEIYMIRAEALLEMGELTDAYGIIELLVGRKGNVAPPNTSAAFLRSYVRALWRIEMPREGSRFANRSEDRLLGKGCVSRCRSRWAPMHE